tara:strand:- start:198 stop:608 length:411 start_codon:yes stop_codon:yes gene_type:complete
MIEILHGLFFTDIKTALKYEIYDEYNINVVINCTSNYPFINRDITKIRLPFSHVMDQTDMQLINKNLSKILDTIQSHFLQKNILICCYDGKLISPLIIALFIMKYGNVKSYDILKVLQSKDSNLSINYDLSQFKLN